MRNEEPLKINSIPKCRYCKKEYKLGFTQEEYIPDCICKYKREEQKRKGKINAKIKEGYSIEEIKQAIGNYCLILLGEEYFFSYRWTLEEFLQKGFEKFKDWQIAKSNYLIKEARSAGVKKHFTNERDYTDEDRRKIVENFYAE